MFRTALIAGLSALLFANDVSGAGARAIDGDTLQVGREVIRILNIDAPEIGGAKCDSERTRGLEAKRRLAALIDRGVMSLKRGDGSRLRDRYGRTLALVFVDGQDVGERLVAEGLARRWNGKRRPWCGQS